MGYSKEWWERRGAEIKAKRAERYRNDPELRRQAAERTRRFRERRKATEKKEPPTVPYGGGRIKGFTIDEVVATTGIPQSRIEYLYRRGYIPPPPVSRPVRLWGQPHITAMVHMNEWLHHNSNRLRTIGPSADDMPQAKADLLAKIEEIKAMWEG